MRPVAVILAFTLCLAATPAFAATIFVEADGTGDVPTIQDAVNASAPGDTILLGNGTFTGTGNRDVWVGGLAVTIRSQSGQSWQCMIDCQGDSLNEHRAFIFSVVVNKQVGQPAIENISIRNGYFDPSGSEAGGAVLCQGVSVVFRECTIYQNTAAYGGAVSCEASGSPVFYDCVIEQNTSFAGGGILCESCSPTIEDCQIRYNTAESAGGGILLVNCSGEITGSLIGENTVDVPVTKKSAGRDRSWTSGSGLLPVRKSRDEAGPGDRGPVFDNGGAGICVYGTGSCLIADCNIRYNSATTSSHFFGGGISAQSGPTLTVTGCDIWNNTVTAYDAWNIAGGAIDAWDTDLTVENCDIWENDLWREGTATYRSGFGGGINAPMPPATIAGCRIAGNGAGLGGGINMSDQWEDSKGEAVISGCTITGNYASEAGGGVYADPFLTTIENSTVSGNRAGESAGGIYGSNPVRTVMLLENTILWGNCVGGAKGSSDEAYFQGPAKFLCCDVNKAGVITDASVVYDPTTFDADPKFCSPANCLAAPTSDGIYTIHGASPCAPERAACGLIGSLGVGCGGTIPVCPDGTGLYERIQDAVDAAWDGDIIELCDGVYTGQGNTMIEVTKPVIIRSKSGNADACIIDMETNYGWGIGFAVEGPAVKGGPKAGLENVTIQNGGWELGGGIVCNGGSPTIRGCKVLNCISYLGAGILVAGDSPVISHCEVAGCMAMFSGGGILLMGMDIGKAAPPAPVLDSCYIHDNRTGFIPVAGAQNGWTQEHMEGEIPRDVQKWLDGRGGFIPGGAGVGALYYVEPLLTGCTIRNNTALPPMNMANKQGIAEFVMGGGLSWSYASGGKIRDCVIRQNAVDFTDLYPDKGPYIPGYGGGIALAVDSSPIIEGCAIDSNYVDLRVDIAPAGPGENFETEPFPGLRQKGSEYPFPGGGGIFCAQTCSPLIVGCSIIDNHVDSWTFTPLKGRGPGLPVGGGGVSFQLGGTLTMRDCTVHSNVVRERTGTGYVILAGGGLLADGAKAKLEDCSFTENALTVPLLDKKERNLWEWHPERGGYPSYGGGLAFSVCVFDLDDCTVADNMSFTGGGMYVESAPETASVKIPGQVGESYIRNSLVAQNIAYSGGGIRQARGTLWIHQSTISGNVSAYAAGVHQESPIAKKQGVPEAATIFEHSILWGNCTEEYTSDQDMYFTGQAEFECCDVNKAGVLAEYFPPDYDASTISEDPMFCCPAYCDLIFQQGIEVPFWTVGDYRIDYFSPCAMRNAPCGKRIGAQGVGCRGNRCEPWEFLPPESFTSVLEEQLAGGAIFRLLPPTPNPFNPVAEIHFSIPAGSDPSRVTLTIYNALGQRVRTLIDEKMGGGIQHAIWDGRDNNGVPAASGVYFCNLRWSGRNETERMVLLK